MDKRNPAVYVIAKELQQFDLARKLGIASGDEGDYASTSEVIREALRDWRLKRELRLRQLAGLKADIDSGLSDVAEGRLANFDADRIIARERELLANRSSSASPKRRKQT